MEVRLISQPYAAERNVIDFLNESLSDSRVDRIDIVVAWLKRSGMRQAQSLLSDFRTRGGQVRIIVGVSQGGATRQGLQLALEYADEAYVFHDSSGRTFHPKLYHARGENCGYTLVGSQNFTRGGLIENYEMGVEVLTDANKSEDREFTATVEDYIRRILAESEVCIKLDRESLRQIMDSPEVSIQDEDGQTTDRTPRKLTEAGRRVFGRTMERLRRAQGFSASPSRGRKRARDVVSGTRAETAERAGPALKDQVVRRWFKALDPSNAQRLPEGRNPTGHLTLTQAGFDIPFGTYFRDEFFAECTWISADTGSPREYALVDFHVVTGGRDHGVLSLQVDHFPSFGSGQGNRTSTLRWGPELNRYLRREVDHSRDCVTVEALADGGFSLIIASGPTGRAIL